MPEPIRVVIADDHAQFRQSLAAILNSEPDIQVVGQGATAKDAVDLSRNLAPDIALVDLDMPGGGLSAAQLIGADHPDVRVVILTASSAEDYAFDARQLGAWGYIVKGVTARELIRILRSVGGGSRFWPAAPEHSFLRADPRSI
jgi:DNA-binding NarL/FixJ family response regulator